jgi:hypothetical protein
MWFPPGNDFIYYNMGHSAGPWSKELGDRLFAAGAFAKKKSGGSFLRSPENIG